MKVSTGQFILKFEAYEHVNASLTSEAQKLVSSIYMTSLVGISFKFYMYHCFLKIYTIIRAMPEWMHCLGTALPKHVYIL